MPERENAPRFDLTIPRKDSIIDGTNRESVASTLKRKAGAAVMRVIAGTARGKNLAALPGEDVTRPTINRVKEAMFSSVQFLLPGAHVLDLFAGSGQLGIEALSRGAAQCTFLDASPEAVRIVTANCRTAEVQDRARISCGDAFNYLHTARGPFDLVLLDPPFAHGTLAKVLPLLERSLAPGGVILCESELQAELPSQTGSLHLVKQYKYGKILVSRYEREEQP